MYCGFIVYVLYALLLLWLMHIYKRNLFLWNLHSYATSLSGGCSIFGLRWPFKAVGQRQLAPARR